MREEVGFRRAFDGHVEVRRRSMGPPGGDQGGDSGGGAAAAAPSSAPGGGGGAGAWLEVKTDAGVPGVLLLRDGADGGRVWYLAVPRVQQVDLTDDFAVAAIFAGGDWERAMQPLQAPAEPGGDAARAGLAVEDVRLDREAFRAVTTVA